MSEIESNGDIAHNPIDLPLQSGVRIRVKKLIGSGLSILRNVNIPQLRSLRESNEPEFTEFCQTFGYFGHEYMLRPKMFEIKALYDGTDTALDLYGKPGSGFEDNCIRFLFIRGTLVTGEEVEGVQIHFLKKIAEEDGYRVENILPYLAFGITNRLDTGLPYKTDILIRKREDFGVLILGQVSQTRRHPWISLDQFGEISSALQDTFEMLTQGLNPEEPDRK